MGDKHPDYEFALDKIEKDDNLLVIAMYRDPRDVISSTMKAYRSKFGKW